MSFKKGLTLMEVMLAALILVVVFLSILAGYILCFDLISTSRNMTLAINGIQWVMEEIRDDNFNNIHTNYNLLPFTLNDLPPDHAGIVYVDNSNPDLLRVTISVCWQEKARIIGEDSNLNWALDAGEDTNGNGIIDSPAQLISLITKR